MSRLRVNKILVVFLISMIGLFVSISTFVQSSYFGSLISGQVSKYVEEKFSTKVEFSRINISLFPMSTTLESVKVFKSDIVSFEFKEVQVSVSPFDVLKSDLKISQIRIHDGYINLLMGDNNSNEDQTLDLKQFRQLNKFLDSKMKLSPVNIGEVVLDEIDIVHEDQKLSIIHSRFELGGTYDYVINLNNFKFKEYSLNEISLHGKIQNNKVVLSELLLLKNRMKVSAFGKLYVEDDVIYDFKVNYSGEIAEFIPKEYVDKFRASGMCECDFKIVGASSKFNVTSFGKIRSIMSNIHDANELIFEAQLDENGATLSKFELLAEQSKLKINKPIAFNYSDKKLETISLKLENFDFGKAINGVTSGQILEGKITGEMNINLFNNFKAFDIKGTAVLDGVKIGATKKVIELEKLNLKDLRVEKNQVLSLSSNGTLGNSKLFLAGNVFDKSLDMKLKLDDFELSELGGIVGGVIGGKGQMDATFKGNFDNIDLKLIANNVKELKILGYNLLYNSNVEMSYLFKDNLISIGKINSSNILEVQNGFVDLASDSLDLMIRFKDLQFHNLKRHLDPLKDKMEHTLEKINGEVSGRVKLTGNFSDINIKGDINSKKISIFSEPLSNLKADFKLDTKKIILNDITLGRGDGFLNLQGEYNFETGIKSLKSSAQGIRLTDFLLYRNLGLGYDTEVNYQLKIEKGKKGFVGAGVTRFLSSSVGRKRIKPSSISFDILNDELILKGTLLGTRLAFDSKIFVGVKSSQKSYLNSTISIEDIRLLLGMLSLHNVYDSDLIGFITSNLQLKFSVNDLSTFDLNAKIEKFFLKKNDKEIELDNKAQNIITISNSDIEALDISVKGSGGEFLLKGLGNLRNKARLEQSFALDLSFLQILSSKIIRASGKLSGSGLFFGSINDFDDSHSIKLENVMVIHKDLPIIVSDLNMTSVLTTKKWEITNLFGKLGSGQVTGKGKIEFVRPVPKMNFGLKLDNISYPIAENSRVLFDAYLDLVGASLPYSLRGNVSLNGGTVNDEFTAFTGGSGVKKSVDKYIKIKEQGLPEVISLNVDVKANEKILIKNRMADLVLTTNAKITESPLNPDIKAKVSLVPFISKFKFKGTEFVVSEGSVNYDSTNTLNTLFLNMTANARISNYDIKMEVVGSDDDLKLNMESNPTLSKEDIFSLLALGVTSDFAKNLEDKDRTSLTTIGLGTLIVDQLKINEGLDSTLGLKLSVLPEVGDNESTPIQNSKNEAISKNKTATKLKIQKKVSNNVGLTFSNTFGSSEGQKQEMNVDYNINKKWSIQGVFESDTESETGDGNSNSLGADIKYRWDF